MKDVKTLMMRKVNVYVKYTLIFIIMFSCCYLRWFWYNNKAMYLTTDGLEQQYTFFVYVQNWIRTIFRKLVVKHELVVPMWDMSIGYGADVLASFGTIVCDPFCWITAWIPVEYSEYVFEFVLMAKFYLAGLMFICFSRYRGNNEYACLVGAIVYSFSPAVYVCFRQASFTNVYILFPLILLGFFKILNHERPYTYMIGIGMSFMLTFYFTYMMCIFLAVFYCLFFITEYKSQNKIKDFFIFAIKYLGYAMAPMFIGLGVIYPMINNLSSTSRLLIEHNDSSKLLFEASKIKKIFLGCITIADFGADDWLGVLPIVFSVSGLLFVIYKRKYALKLAYVLLCLSLFVPLVGSIFNGFNYTTFRWIFGFVIVSAYAVTVVLNNIDNISLKAIIAEMLLITLITAITIQYGGFDSEWTRGSIFTIWITFFVLCFYRYGKRESFARILILFITMISACASSYFFFAPSKRNFISVANERGIGYHTLLSSGGKDLLQLVNKKKGFRYDEGHLSRSKNSSLIVGMSGMDFYNSYYNQNIDNYHNNLGLVTDPWNFGYFGLDKRSVLESLNGVRYYIVDSEDVTKRPYGYGTFVDSVNVDVREYLLYSADEKINMFSLMDNVISEQNYLNSGMELREQILSRACVLDDDNELINTTKEKLNLRDDSVEYWITPSDENIYVEGNKIIVKNTDSYLKLGFNEVSRAQVEVLIKNLSVNTAGVRGFFVNAEACSGDIKQGGLDKGTYNLTSISHMYGGKHNWLMNLGFSDQPVDNIRLSFNSCGEYSFDDLKINLKTEQHLIEDISSINHDVKNINIKTNEMSFDVDNKDEKILFASVPYSDGWSVKIDDNEGTIYKADDAFMAVQLPQGKHKVQFMYITPEWKKCVFFFAAGIFLSTLIVIKTEKGKK